MSYLKKESRWTLKKIKAITEWPKPKNISKLRGFLGLTGYYQRFIKNYAHLTTPMSNILNKNSFQWNNKAKECFETLKKVYVICTCVSVDVQICQDLNNNLMRI